MRDAVEHCRRVLGERWRGWREHSHFARSFHTSIQGGEREWVRLHRLVRALDGVVNVELLVKDLGSPAWHKHVAAEQSLEFCGRMHCAGHHVEIIKNTDEVSPDVRVNLHDRAVTIELKALHDPDAQIPWDDFFEALHSELFRRRPCAEVLPFDVEFFAPALKHLSAVADALVAIAACGDAELHDLPHEAGRARYVGDASAPRLLRFPVDQRDDLDRILANLDGKYGRQLRAVDGPTLLVVLTKNVFFVPIERIPNVARNVATSLLDALSQRQAISGILLHEEPLAPAPRPILHVDDGWRFAMCETERRARTALLVPNAAGKFSLTEPELCVLVGNNACWQVRVPLPSELDAVISERSLSRYANWIRYGATAGRTLAGTSSRAPKIRGSDHGVRP